MSAGEASRGLDRLTATAVALTGIALRERPLGMTTEEYRAEFQRAGEILWCFVEDKKRADLAVTRRRHHDEVPTDNKYASGPSRRWQHPRC